MSENVRAELLTQIWDGYVPNRVINPTFANTIVLDPGAHERQGHFAEIAYGSVDQATRLLPSLTVQVVTSYGRISFLSICA